MIATAVPGKRAYNIYLQRPIAENWDFYIGPNIMLLQIWLGNITVNPGTD